MSSHLPAHSGGYGSNSGNGPVSPPATVSCAGILCTTYTGTRGLVSECTERHIVNVTCNFPTATSSVSVQKTIMSSLLIARLISLIESLGQIE